MENEEFDFNITELTRLMDRTKAKVFMGRHAAFLAPLMCSMNFVWSEDISTAATNGVTLWWNPQWFLALSENTRQTVLLHELWHVARLHFLRMGSRNPLIWNWACDIRINNDLYKQGYSFEGTAPWMNQMYGTMAEEEIYDVLIQNGEDAPDDGSWGATTITGSPMKGLPAQVHEGDMILMTPEEEAIAVRNVLKAKHAAVVSGHSGSIPGDIEMLLKQFLSPVIPWESELHKFFNDLLSTGHTWRRPNRRFQDIYLPGRIEDRGLLDHLAYYWDVSGSIQDKDIVRFNSEVRFIKEYFKPKKLTLVQFDTRITDEKTFLEEDPFEDVKVIGRGGTDLEPVRQHIMEHRPTAAIIFSDLECPPMQSLPFDIPIIWIVVNNVKAQVPFGKLLHVRS